MWKRWQQSTISCGTALIDIPTCTRRCGEKPAAFRYRPVGELALVGKHAGVTQVFGLKFSGLLAWAMWRAVYLAKMPGAAQRARVVADWLLRAALSDSERGPARERKASC